VSLRFQPLFTHRVPEVIKEEASEGAWPGTQPRKDKKFSSAMINLE
jgi:hypothetical protein